MILTKIDRYIIRKFLGTFVFILFILMSISIVFDLAEKINDFLGAGAPWDAIIFDYYVNFFLYYSVQFCYLINFISVIFFTSKLANNTEIVPILSSGVSFNRFLRPYFISSFIIAITALVMYNYVLPIANQKRVDFENHYHKDFSSKANGRIQVSEHEIVYFRTWDAYNAYISQFSLENWHGNMDSLNYIFRAEKAVGDSLSNDWSFSFYEIRYFGYPHDEVITGIKTDTTMNFSISDLVFKSNIIECMNNRELNAFIEKERRHGSDKIPIYLIEKHKRMASPFAIFILTLIGVSVSSRKARGGLGVNIALGLSVAVLYIFAMQMTTVAAIKVGFTPGLAVWLPNIIFSVVAFILYKKAPK